MITLVETTLIHAPIERVFDLARSVEVHLLGNVHFGEQAITLPGRNAVTSGLICLGDQVTWRARHFGVRQRLTSAITAMDRPHFFQDTMLQGAFRSMQHDHTFEALPNGATRMHDTFRFAAPIPLLGLFAERLVLRRYMQALLHERNRIIQQVAESDQWQKYLKQPGPPQRDGPGIKLIADTQAHSE